MSYTRLLREVLAKGCYVGIATHDEKLVFEAIRLTEEHEVPRERFEFQMLLGVDEELRRILVDLGYRTAGLRALRGRVVPLLGEAPQGEPRPRGSGRPERPPITRPRIAIAEICPRREERPLDIAGAPGVCSRWR
jgi:hypothetical protein